MVRNNKKNLASINMDWDEAEVRQLAPRECFAPLLSDKKRKNRNNNINNNNDEEDREFWPCIFCNHNLSGLHVDGCDCEGEFCVACIREIVNSKVESMEEWGQGIECPGGCGKFWKMDSSSVLGCLDESVVNLVKILETSSWEETVVVEWAGESMASAAEEEEEEEEWDLMSNDAMSNVESIDGKEEVCQVCFSDQNALFFPRCCGRGYCYECLADFADTILRDKLRIYKSTDGLPCPFPDCRKGLISFSELSRALPSTLFSSICERIRYVPPSPSSSSLLRIDPGDLQTLSSVLSGLPASMQWTLSNTRQCPRCFVRIEKNGGCDHMICAVCRHDFQWPEAPNLVHVPRSVVHQITNTTMFEIVPNGDPSKKKVVTIARLSLQAEADIKNLKLYRGSGDDLKEKQFKRRKNLHNFFASGSAGAAVGGGGGERPAPLRKFVSSVLESGAAAAGGSS